jgi:hypothetical protein
MRTNKEHFISQSCLGGIDASDPLTPRRSPCPAGPKASIFSSPPRHGLLSLATVLGMAEPAAAKMLAAKHTGRQTFKIGDYRLSLCVGSHVASTMHPQILRYSPTIAA